MQYYLDYLDNGVQDTEDFILKIGITLALIVFAMRDIIYYIYVSIRRPFEVG